MELGEVRIALTITGQLDLEWFETGLLSIYGERDAVGRNPGQPILELESNRTVVIIAGSGGFGNEIFMPDPCFFRTAFYRFDDSAERRIVPKQTADRDPLTKQTHYVAEFLIFSAVNHPLDRDLSLAGQAPQHRLKAGEEERRSGAIISFRNCRHRLSRFFIKGKLEGTKLKRLLFIRFVFERQIDRDRTRG